MQEFETVVGQAIPSPAPELDTEVVEPVPSWSPEQEERAEQALFERLTSEDESGTDGRGGGGRKRGHNPKSPGKPPLSASQATWRNVWTLYAAGILLFIALGVSAYQVGIRRGSRTAVVMASILPVGNPNLEQQASDAGHERELLRAQVVQRDQVVAELRRQLAQHSAEIGRMKLAQDRLEKDLRSGQAGRQDLLQQRSELRLKLEAAEAKTRGLQDRLDSLERQSSQDKQRATALEAKVSDLTSLLRDRETAIDQQQELLAHDRDIRDLMGARDLYVAEVYDVERTGETRKPYGRVFYTKGKSLIFYAYDLDQQPGVKSASTFQAWGRRGPDRQQALSLGVFYVDNASKKRWVLKFDDPKALAQIDAVFVTVEPNGGSHKPSNKPLLFAYLHIDPNHP
jgi:hypothetical protein